MWSPGAEKRLEMVIHAKLQREEGRRETQGDFIQEKKMILGMRTPTLLSPWPKLRTSSLGDCDGFFLAVPQSYL